jgi:hypothetical protein
VNWSSADLLTVNGKFSLHNKNPLPYNFNRQFVFRIRVFASPLMTLKPRKVRYVRMVDTFTRLTTFRCKHTANNRYIYSRIIDIMASLKMRSKFAQTMTPLAFTLGERAAGVPVVEAFLCLHCPFSVKAFPALQALAASGKVCVPVVLYAQPWHDGAAASTRALLTVAHLKGDAAAATFFAAFAAERAEIAGNSDFNAVKAKLAAFAAAAGVDAAVWEAAYVKGSVPERTVYGQFKQLSSE